jgi:RNA polymerase sporulation-specific sigma factor
MTEEQRKLVEDHIKLAWFMTHKWAKRGTFYFGIDEMFSIFSLALCKAGYTYSNKRGTKFITYATKCMENEIRMAFRKRFNTGQSRELSMISMDKFGNEVDYSEIFTDDTHLELDEVLDLMVLKDALNILNDKELRILKLRYCDEISQQKIAGIINISRSYVSRIERRSLRKLKKWYDENVQV